MGQYVVKSKRRPRLLEFLQNNLIAKTGPAVGFIFIPSKCSLSRLIKREKNLPATRPTRNPKIRVGKKGVGVIFAIARPATSCSLKSENKNGISIGLVQARLGPHAWTRAGAGGSFQARARWSLGWRVILEIIKVGSRKDAARRRLISIIFDRMVIDFMRWDKLVVTFFCNPDFIVL